MKPPAVFHMLAKRVRDQAKARSELTSRASSALSLSKRAIFALHRDDCVQAQQHLKAARELLHACEKLGKSFSALRNEGVFHAALEEYAEALLFDRFITKGSFGPVDAQAMEAGVYLGGLCDATGELVRYAMRQTTKGNHGEVERAFEATEIVINFLLELDLTGYLRTKFDQAKKNLRHLEQMRYDLHLRSV